MWRLCPQLTCVRWVSQCHSFAVHCWKTTEHHANTRSQGEGRPPNLSSWSRERPTTRPLLAEIWHCSAWHQRAHSQTLQLPLDFSTLAFPLWLAPATAGKEKGGRNELILLKTKWKTPLLPQAVIMYCAFYLKPRKSTLCSLLPGSSIWNFSGLFFPEKSLPFQKVFR